MSTASVVVRYDGPALANHRMEVGDLAPALLGISELCKVANRRFNGERASMQIYIGADQEQQCFQFSIEVVQTIWQHAQNFIGDGPVDAEQILKILGLIGAGVSATGSAVYGLLKLYAALKGKNVSQTTFETINGRDVLRLEIKGDNNVVNNVVNNTIIYAEPKAYDLLKDPYALAQAKKIVEPVTKPGIERLEFERPSAGEKETITADDAADITAPDDRVEPPQSMEAWIKVYAPVYDPSAQQWQFQFGDGHVYMDIADTDIAAKALERGGALANDTYKVRLQIQQSITPTGRISSKYKILEVQEFHPAQIGEQADLTRDDPSD